MLRALAIASLLCASAAGADEPVAPKSGAAMCVLTADDFKAAGIAGAGKPTAGISDGASTANCTYAVAGLALDVFFPAGISAADLKETEEMVAGQSGAVTLTPLKLAGTDSARWSASARTGGPELAVLVVRRDKLVFLLSVPKHTDAQAQLTRLAGVVLKRLGLK